MDGPRVRERSAESEVGATQRLYIPKSGGNPYAEGINFLLSDREAQVDPAV